MREEHYELTNWEIVMDLLGLKTENYHVKDQELEGTNTEMQG